MAKSGWLIWKDRFIEWEYHSFASKTDLTFSPHFRVTVADRSKDKTKSITFDNVQVKGSILKKTQDLTKLPVKEQESILNVATAAWEHEYASKK